MKDYETGEQIGKQKACFGMGLFAIVFAFVALIFGLLGGLEKGYQNGQTDALHGKWSYRLKTNQVEVVERVKE